MKSILLISANRHCTPYPVYPLGLAYLHGYLEKKLPEYHIQIADCNILDNQQLAKFVEQIDPAYICISLRNVDGANSLDNSNFIDSYKGIVTAVREKSASPIIIGGAGFSIFPKPIFDSLQPDYGIVGEGEESLYKLIDALERKESTDGIDGVVAYSKERFICNGHRSYLKELSVKFDSELSDFYWKRSGMLNIQTKRGCPYNCIYCSYPVIDGSIVRTLDADFIVDSIARLKRETGVNYLFFTDSVFNISDKFNAELAEKIVKSGVKINWGAYFAPMNLTDEMMQLYKASGLTHIEFGTESFSNQQLKNYGKRFTFSEVLKSSELCLKHNIYYAHFLILGGYGETLQSLGETMENSKQISHSVFFPYVGMRIYPQTILQQIAIRKGVISADNNLLEPAYYVEDGFDLEQARQMAQETGKAWIFPDDPMNDSMDLFRIKRNKKGLLWEYLRKP